MSKGRRIKSSKVKLSYSNKNKLNTIKEFILEYQKVTSLFIDIIWTLNKIPSLLPKEITNQVINGTWLSARAVQASGKQASAIVRGTRKKQEKRLYIIKKLNKENKLKQARKLQLIYDNVKMSKPNIKSTCPELDSRFIKLGKNKTFDWITLSNIGNKLKIEIPFKKHKHFNKLQTQGKLLKGIRLSENNITFNFELPKIEYKDSGNTLGIDVGKKTTISISNGTAINEDKHGHTFDSICAKIARKNKGSKAFLRAQQHRTNYIHWCCNQIDTSKINKVKIEKIRYLNKGKRISRKMQAWNYKELLTATKDYFNDQNVSVVEVNPTYTSQRCSACGWTRKSNRQGKLFCCSKCGYITDADINASLNIALDLKPINKKERLTRKNRKGFYWLEQDLIVPAVQKRSS